MNITNRAAIESACKFVEERVEPRKCDSDAVSSCWRCNSVYLAKRMRELLGVPSTESAPPIALSTIHEWFWRRIKAAGGHITDLSAFVEEVVRWTEGRHAVSAPAQLPESMSRDEMLKYYSEYANVQCNEALRYQQRIRELESALVPQPPQDERCPVCGEDEPFTGTCGAGDKTNALCKRPAKPAPPVALSTLTDERALNALRALVGNPEDPNIGWLGNAKTSKDHFRCEHCGVEDLDCGKIAHLPTCPIPEAVFLAASAPAQQAGLKDCSHPSCGCEEGEGCKADKYNDALLNEAYAEGRKDEAEARAKGEPPSDELSSECLDCGGTGMRDSGGFQPWGEAISVPCDCGAAAPPQPVAAEVAKQARFEALEQAANLVENYDTHGDIVGGWQEIFAIRIRALAGTGSDESGEG